MYNKGDIVIDINNGKDYTFRQYSISNPEFCVLDLFINGEFNSLSIVKVENIKMSEKVVDKET